MADEFFLDPRAVRRSFDRASRTYDASAAVQAEIRTRLLERLDIVRLQPTAVLDLGAGTGHASRDLKRRYPSAQVVAVDASLPMLRESAHQQRFLRRFASVCADAHRLPLRSQSFDLVLSNLLIEWCHDPDAVFAEAARVLRPQGLFTFTTVGPDTLKELRELWRGVDPFTHVHRFIDMHDFGDAPDRHVPGLVGAAGRTPRRRRAQPRAGQAARAHGSRAWRRRAVTKRSAPQERPVAHQR
jgi:malonyl-CoA O-methyltransferase